MMNPRSLAYETNIRRKESSEGVSVNSSKNIPRQKIYQRGPPPRNYPNYPVRSIDYSSNVEFTSIHKESQIPTSLMNIKPDFHNITPHRVNVDLENSRNAQKRRLNRMPYNPEDYGLRTRPTRLLLDINEVGPEGVPLYKIWLGNNKFLMKGKLMTGPKSDRVANTVAWTFILVFSAAFFAGAFRFLLQDVTFLLPIISIYLFVSTVSFFLLTSFTDPGVIPRRCVWEINGEVPWPFNGRPQKDSIESINTQTMNDGSKGRFINRNNGMVYCPICEIWKPPKASHCNLCGNCCELHSHHSHFTRNCIGKRNYKYYVGFITSLILLGICYLSSLLMVIITAIGSEEDPTTLFQNTTVTIIIILILGIPSFSMLFATIIISCGSFSSKIKKNMSPQHPAPMNPEDNLSGKRPKSVNWWRKDPVLFNPRQIVTKDQFMRYKNSLAEEGIATLN